MESVPIIHVHTQVDKSTVPYAQFMWQTMLELANHPGSLKITVHCMGPKAHDRAQKWVTQGEAVIIQTPASISHEGSTGHGACIMDALKHTGDGAIHIIADSDTVVVARGWDDYVRFKLLNEKLGIIGTTYEDPGGFSSGKNTVQTYKKVPSVTWCALTPMHDWRTLDVMPNKGHQIGITTETLSKIYNLPIGFSVFGEVGWQLPQYIYDNDLTYEGWEQVKASKGAKLIKGLSDYHEEYHVQEGMPFLLHHRGSLRHVYRGDRISNAFYSAVDTYLSSERKAEKRWVWTPDGELQIPKFESAKPLPPPPPKTAVPRETNSMPFSPGSTWIKAAFNGDVIRPRTSFDKSRPISLSFGVPAVDKIGNLRIEGLASDTPSIVVPDVSKVPYVLIVRNLVNVDVEIRQTYGEGVTVPAGKTWMLLVDVGAVDHVE